MTPTDIAAICYEANRAYCVTIGDNSQPPWNEAADWQKLSAEDGVRFHLKNPLLGPEASHENWLKKKSEEGWTYGPVKDPERKEHPCMVPFKSLPIEQQLKDYIFRAIVLACASALTLIGGVGQSPA